MSSMFDFFSKVESKDSETKAEIDRQTNGGSSSGSTVKTGGSGKANGMSRADALKDKAARQKLNNMSKEQLEALRAKIQANKKQ